MSEPGKAVFISYASQDAEAVGRIAAALRTTGLEVWFDKDELRGGDAWDQKIRRQIKECTLFVPVISRNTDARPEGYFRLEWKLAVDRSHLIADDHAFLVPVIVDDTPEATARVPDKFREVQWTRLVLTETPTAFAVRMRDLLGGVSVAGGRRAGDREPAGKRSDAIFWSRIVPIAGLAVGLFFAFRSSWYRRGGEERGPRIPAVAPPPIPVAAPPAVKAVPALSEARKLMQQAKALYEPWDGATRADFTAADKLLGLAVEKDPADGEVWAASALMDCGQIVLGHDRSPARLERARMAAERAVRLAPDSVQAKFAQAFTYRFNSATRGSVEQTLRELIEQAPTDRLLIRTYASVLREQRKYEEAIKVLDRAIALPGGDPVAEFNQFQALSGLLRHPEAEALLDRSIAAHPQPFFYRAKAQVLLARADLDGAVALLNKLPPAYLLDDDGALMANKIYLWRREPEKALDVLKGIGRDILENNEFNGPRAFLLGQANQLANRPAAADVEWKAALRLVESRYAEQPNVIQWVYWKARLFATLGRKEEAEEALKTFEQLAGLTGVIDSTISVYLLLGRKEAVLAALEKGRATVVANGNATQLTALVNNFRLNPEWDLLRDEPRFAKLLEK